MLLAIAELEAMTPFHFNRHISTELYPLLPNETKDQWEERNWKERAEFNVEGNAVLTPVRFKNAIVTGAQWLNMKIPGEGGKATYSKHFRGGLIVKGIIDTKIPRGELKSDRIFTSPKKGDGKRWIHFPLVEQWRGIVEFTILDEKITPEVFTKALEYSGFNVGIGAHRPENAGDNGRYEIVGEIQFQQK